MNIEDEVVALQQVPMRPQHICETNENPLIYYIAYNGQKLRGMIIGFDPFTSYNQVDLVLFTNMRNANGDKNFGQQYHQNVPYDESERPIIGTWRFIKF